MVKIFEKIDNSLKGPVFLCDFTPSKGGGLSSLEDVRYINTDFISVAYSPGKSVRTDTIVTAYSLKMEFNKEVIFTVSTRDMNKLAIQNWLLGADLLSVRNVLVVAGDDFTKEELAVNKSVRNFTTTELIASIKHMNNGIDYRGYKLKTPTAFCVGAAIDFDRDTSEEVFLTHKKILSGSDFFVTQPVFDISNVDIFYDVYRLEHGVDIDQPIFVGVQVLNSGSKTFSNLPDTLRSDLDAGRDPIDIAMSILGDLYSRGINKIYLIPAILPGGKRDYTSVKRIIDSFSKLF